MTDLFDLPTRRELPDAVRDRARTTILAELDAADRPSALRTIGPLSISAAAVVAVLAAGFVGLVASDHGQGGRAIPASPSRTVTPPRGVVPSAYQVRDHSAPAESNTRCKAQAGHEPAGTPEPAQWQPIATVSANGVDLIAYQTPAGDVFCEITPTTVTLSDPAAQRAPDGTPTFVTPMGSVAGPADAFISAIAVKSAGGSGRQAVIVGDVFLLPNGFPTGPVTTAVVASNQGANSASRPSYPGHTTGAALPTITDRTVAPADQTSPAGQRLAACLAHPSGAPVVVPQAWTPGASETLADGGVTQLGRYGDLLAVCGTSNGRTTLSVVDLGAPHLPVSQNPDVLAGWANDGSTTVTLAGVTTSAKVARVQVVRDGTVIATATVQNGTFVVPALPETGVTLVAQDAGGATLATLPLG